MFDYFGREVMFEELYNNTLKDLPVNEVSDDDLKFLLDLSFNLTKAKRKK